MPESQLFDFPQEMTETQVKADLIVSCWVGERTVSYCRPLASVVDFYQQSVVALPATIKRDGNTWHVDIGGNVRKARSGTIRFGEDGKLCAEIIE